MKLLIAAEVFLSKNKYTCCRCYGFVGIAHARVATSDKGIFYATVKRRLETEACADLTILIVNLWKSCFQCLSLFLQHFLLCFNDLQFFNSVFNLSLCYDEISSHSAKPRQALKYLRNLVRLIIPLSCFQVLCGTLAFGFPTPLHLRSTGFCFAYDYITNIFHYFFN